MGTDSDVVVGGLLVVEVVVGEEAGQIGLDAAQGLVLSMEQQDEVRHTEALEHQRQKLPKEPCRSDSWLYLQDQSDGWLHLQDQSDSWLHLQDQSEGWLHLQDQSDG